MRQLVKEKENSEFKLVKLRLKTDLVSYPAQVEELVNMNRGRINGERERERGNRGKGRNRERGNEN